MDHRTETATTAPAPWLVPDWLSPSRVIALTVPTFETVVVPAGILTEIAKRDPSRVGIFVLFNQGPGLGVSIGPTTDVAVHGIPLSATNPYFAATLADWLSVVNGAWFAFSAGGTTVQVIECVRP